MNNKKRFKYGDYFLLVAFVLVIIKYMLETLIEVNSKSFLLWFVIYTIFIGILIQELFKKRKCFSCDKSKIPNVIEKRGRQVNLKRCYYQAILIKLVKRF